MCVCVYVYVYVYVYMYMYVCVKWLDVCSPTPLPPSTSST